MVRPTSSVWLHYIKETHYGKSIAICRYCHNRYLVPNATKMAKHIQKCLKQPLEVLPSFPVIEDSYSDHSLNVYDVSVIPTEHPDLNDVVTSLDLGSSSSSVLNETASFHPPKRAKIETQSAISSFVDSMSNSEASKLDLAFARAIYSSNCPLSLTENVYWKEFLHQIRPSYKVPSRHDLSTTLLDKEYSNVKEMNKDRINKAQFLTVLSDGWSNVNSENIISFIVSTPAPIFYKSIETKDNKHTGVYISEEISKVIDDIGNHKVIAVVTDNASNMKAAWRLLQVKYPNLNTLGCSAHGLNLLLGDIAKIETFQRLIDRSKDIIKYFKNKHTLLAIFTEKQKIKKGISASTLKLPAETRWASTRIMFQSLIDGKESLQETVLHESIDKDLRQQILDNDIFWASIESLNSVLKPICDGIAILESDDAVLSDVPHIFNNIKNSLGFLKSTPLQMEEEERFIAAVEERQKMFCQPIHFATYILDPRYQEICLNSAEYETAIEFLTNFPSFIPGEVIANLALFRAREGVYSGDGVLSSAKYISPLVWWKGLFKNEVLGHIATKLFSIPPSSAACERIFSAFSKTHTVLRNRLNNDSVKACVCKIKSTFKK